MVLTPIQTLLLCGTLWLLWKFLKPRVIRTNFDNIPGPAPESFFIGNLKALSDRHGGWDNVRKLTQTYGSVLRLRGLLGANMLYVSDPVALQHIFTHDGVSYELAQAQLAFQDISFGPGLVSVTGQVHKRQRRMLNPVFSTENLRRMTPIFYDIAHKLRSAIMTQVQDCPQHVDVIHWLSRTALEIVAQAALGCSFDPLTADVQAAHPISEAVKGLIPVFTQLSIWRLTVGILWRLGPPRFRRWLVDLAVAVIPDPKLGKLRDIIDMIDETTKKVFQHKKCDIRTEESALLARETEFKDLMSLLLEANAQSSAQDQLSEKELLSQMTAMLFGGTETVSGLMSRIFHLFAMHPDIQEDLRRELAAARDHTSQDIPYEKLMQLPLLDAVCRETLRLYAPVMIMPREVLSDVIMPLHEPIRGLDGKLMHELHVPKGTTIFCAYWSCNTSKDIWGEDAWEWKPERWLSPLPSSVTEARVPGVLSNLTSFGGGYRACIAWRFAQIEAKAVLAILLETLRFSLTDREIFWNFSFMGYPTMDQESVEPSLVLKVESIESRDNV